MPRESKIVVVFLAYADVLIRCEIHMFRANIPQYRPFIIIMLLNFDLEKPTSA